MLHGLTEFGFLLLDIRLERQGLERMVECALIGSDEGSPGVEDELLLVEGFLEWFYFFLYHQNEVKK